MNDNNKSSKINTKYTRKLFKFASDDDFFKSSSEDISDSVSFHKEIKASEENENNILKINKQSIEKIINSKGSTSSSNKFKKIYIKNEEDKKGDKHNNNCEEDKKEKKAKIMIMNNSQFLPNRQAINSKNKTIQINSDQGNEEDDKNVFDNIIDSSSCKSSSRLNSNTNKNNLSNKSDKNSFHHIKINHISRKRSPIVYSNRSSSSNNQIIKKEKADDCSVSQNDSNDNNMQDIIRLKHVKRSTNKSKLKSNIDNSKKLAIMPTSNEPEKKISNNNVNRKKSRRITQRENSINSSNLFNSNEKLNKNKIKYFIIKYLFNIPFLIIMIIMNVFTLFSSDIRHIWIKKNADIYFDVINLVAILYFLLEIILYSFLDEVYLNGFPFWLDTIGTIFIIFNVEILCNYIFGYNKINQSSYRIINNSIEYLQICLMMFERVIRIAKIVQCIKIYNTLQIINKYKYIYSQKQQTELIKKKNQKQKLIQKIQDIEAVAVEENEENEDNEDNIKESVISNESHTQTRRHSTFEVELEKEENEVPKMIRRGSKAMPMNIGLQSIQNIQNIQRTKTKTEERKNEKNSIKRSSFLKKINRNIVRRESVKSLRSLRYNNNLNNRNSIQSQQYETLKIHNFDEDKVEDKNEEIEEEIFRKIDETIKNDKITNKVLASMRKKVKFFFIILILVSAILNDKLVSGFQNKDHTLFFSYIFDVLINHPYKNVSLYNDKIINIIKDDDYPIVNITKNDVLLYENENLTVNNFRLCELVKISSNNEINNTNEIISIIYSVKSENDIKHIFYLVLTLSLCISMILASIISESDLTHILLNPFEVMIELAENVSRDPMNAKNIKELEQGVISLLQKNKEKEKTLFNENIDKTYNECYKSYEVKVIMNSIIKISALLAMSVGEAGGEIIQKNLSSVHGLHLHSRGKKKSAIFGFCNLRDFEEINLALEEETIPLINQIADIVHTSVELYRGNTNKNIGDSFLNVWKFYNNNLKAKNGYDKKLIKDNLLEVDSLNPQINITADCAVLAYLRIILKIHKNLNILRYNNNKKLNMIRPNFQINMGFGLHLGYGIEGPVGSLFKMEASYLSPDVNIAARLETATKQFGVTLLISGKLYNLFTEEMKEVCRYVDCVTVKGSSEPIDLYTIDIDYKVTPQKREQIKIIKNPEEKIRKFKEKKSMLECLIQEYGGITRLLLEKKSYWELIDEKSELFYDSWENGIKFYKEGKWEKAKTYFEECLSEDLNDGPANTLYNFIKKYNFKSPKNWKGKRELTNK